MSPEPVDQLADLTGEIEWRLIGRSKRRLTGAGSRLIPDGGTFVLVVFDGLGVAQLEHERAATFRESQAGVLFSPFPTTTSVALASLVTATSPGEHGLIAYLMYRPELKVVVNTLKWIDLAGSPVQVDNESVLPGPNLWERLRDAGMEPITVQPGGFSGSPLSRTLYRGARFEPVYTYDEMVEATVSLASQPGRLILTYVPPVDVAGHMHGLESVEFDEAMALAAMVWDRLEARLPAGVTLIGTADHGLLEFDDAEKLIMRDPKFDVLRFAGDARGVHLWGDADLIEAFGDVTGGELVDPEAMFDGVRTPAMGDKLLLAPPHRVVLPPGFDKRLRCYHGGLDPAETDVPLLIG